MQSADQIISRKLLSDPSLHGAPRTQIGRMQGDMDGHTCAGLSAFWKNTAGPFVEVWWMPTRNGTAAGSASTVVR